MKKVIYILSVGILYAIVVQKPTYLNEIEKTFVALCLLAQAVLIIEICVSIVQRRDALEENLSAVVFSILLSMPLVCYIPVLVDEPLLGPSSVIWGLCFNVFLLIVNRCTFSPLKNES